MLETLDCMGVFGEAVAKQVLQIIGTLKGDISNNTFIDATRLNDLKVIDYNDEDFMLLQFQKDYLRTTSTMAIRYKQVNRDVSFLGNNQITNPYFKDARFKTKCGLKIIMQGDAIYFALNTTRDPFNEQDVANVKAKIF
ncbi:unnamed protein product [Cunninghamella echinulata]